MSMDLNAAGTKVVGGAGGGTSFLDPLVQTVQITQTNLGAIPVTETAVEGALGTTGDTGWSGSGVGSLIALLKSIALRWGVGGAVSDGSGTITAGGTAQNLFGGTTPVNGYLVQNTSNAVMWINDTGAAATAGGSSFVINPASEIVSPPGYKPPGALSIFCATTGQTFAARKW
jgi:hypothetical protein